MFGFKRKQEITTAVGFKISQSNRRLISGKEYKEIDLELVAKDTEKGDHAEPKVVYDSNILQESLAQSNRYKHLKPAALLNIIGEQPKYEYLKKMAISRLEETLRKQFVIISKIANKEDADNEQTVQYERLSHGVFSWRWSDFLERRKQKSFVWVDILLRKPGNQLHYLKFRNDMNELEFFLSKIFHGFSLQVGKGDVDVYQGIATIIDEAKKTLQTLDNIENEFYTNSKELRYVVYKEYLFTDAKRHSEEKLLKSYLENRLINSHILDPIETRYQLNWFDSLVQQNQYHIETTTQMYQADISLLAEKENMENFINGNCLDYCYSTIELYKNRINDMQNKYDKEVDKMDTKLTILRLQIEKIKEQRNWLTSEIQRFHDEERKMEEETNVEGQQQMTLTNV